MAKQDYVIKKFVRASSAGEALEMDRDTAVAEVFLVQDKPDKLESAVGFQIVTVEERA